MTSTALPYPRVGAYRLLSELGRGGMAVVYLARKDGTSGEEGLCAIKMIHSHLSDDPEFVQLLLDEARIVTRIHNPNVISAEDTGVHDGRMYLRMSYVSGETLFQALSRTWNEDHSFPLDVAVRIFADIANGLHAAHELTNEAGERLSVVHRDPGPHNIMVGYDGVSRVMDFGIAKALDRRSFTQTGTIRGTIAFMSPEQVRGEKLDRRADLFSLGVALWETTVGSRLFKHASVPGTMARILEMEVPRPSTLREAYPPALEAVVLKCLERDKSKRYATALELKAALLLAMPGVDSRDAVGRVSRFMHQTFPERLAERKGVEEEARTNSSPGRLSSALSAHHETELRTVVAPAFLAQAPQSDLSQSAGLAEVRPRVTGNTKITERFDRPTGDVVAPRMSAGRPWIAPLMIAVMLIALVGAIARVVVTKPPKAATGPLMVTLAFRLDPPHAQLSVDGRPQKGALVVPLSPQAYRVEISAVGYQAQSMIVSAEADQAFSVKLEPTPPARRGRGRKRSR